MADSVDDDDFGDLYADLDDQVNYRVATFNGLPNCGAALEEHHGGSGVKNEESLGEDGQSSGEGRIMGFNQARDLIIEAASEKNNESEDDLRIVLNEEGRSKLMGDAWRAYIGNGVQEEVEDEKDNLVIVVGSDGLADDCRRGELVAAQGMPREDRERKHNFSGWHAGFSYFARDGWDHHMMQYLRDSSYCKSGLPVVGQSGSCFSLPRNSILKEEIMVLLKAEETTSTLVIPSISKMLQSFLTYWEEGKGAQLLWKKMSESSSWKFQMTTCPRSFR